MTQADLTEPFATADHVAESRFGRWFLATETWEKHVLTRATNDLARLIVDRKTSYPVIVDIGCGSGRSFKLLNDLFRPSRMIGVDSDAAMLQESAAAVRSCGLAVEFCNDSAARLSLPSASVDMIFCHQTFHHLVAQEAALREFFRVLKPGGVMLMAESTRRYIHSWIIRLLFRHDMSVQRSAAEYLAMIRATGFRVEPQSISYPYLWWSRPDLGIFERAFGIRPPETREETLINLVAVRP
jgi:ubiquinone/menaquinone biosynthesis C-methylase UbiE